MFCLLLKTSSFPTTSRREWKAARAGEIQCSSHHPFAVAPTGLAGGRIQLRRVTVKPCCEECRTVPCQHGHLFVRQLLEVCTDRRSEARVSRLLLADLAIYREPQRLWPFPSEVAMFDAIELEPADLLHHDENGLPPSLMI